MRDETRGFEREDREEGIYLRANEGDGTRYVFDGNQTADSVPIISSIPEDKLQEAMASYKAMTGTNSSGYSPNSNYVVSPYSSPIYYYFPDPSIQQKVDALGERVEQLEATVKEQGESLAVRDAVLRLILSIDRKDTALLSKALDVAKRLI